MLTTAISRQKRFLTDISIYLRICFFVIAFLVIGELGLIWFGTAQQINISTTLTYSGRVRSLTQKLLGESMNVVYAHNEQSMKDLAVDLADWTARHDAIWHGNSTLHVLSVTQYPDILPTVDGVEKNYLEMHSAIVGILSDATPLYFMRYIALVNADSSPVYAAMDAYNNYLRGLTTTYQTQIFICGISATIIILAALLFSVFAIFRPALNKLQRNVVDIAEANAATLKQKEELQLVLDETRQNDHGTRLPVQKIGKNQYNVQGPKNVYLVEKKNNMFFCQCTIYRHNHFCLHVKLAQSADQQAS
jgi:hypothetical protein